MQNKTLIIGILLFGLISCGQHNAKSNSEQATDSIVNENSVSDILPDTDTSTFNNAKAIEMLKEFYSSYATLWDKEIPFDVFSSKQDSLMYIYCTQEIQKKTQKVRDEYDILTDNWPIETNSLKSMKITKDSMKNDCYIVSYSANIYPNNQPVMYDITLYVSVVKIGEYYKISDVKSEDYISVDE